MKIIITAVIIIICLFIVIRILDYFIQKRRINNLNSTVQYKKQKNEEDEHKQHIDKIKESSDKIKEDVNKYVDAKISEIIANNYEKNENDDIIENRNLDEEKVISENDLNESIELNNELNKEQSTAAKMMEYFKNRQKSK